MFRKNAKPLWETDIREKKTLSPDAARSWLTAAGSLHSTTY